MTAPTGHSVIDIFSDCSGTVNIPEAHEDQPSMYGAERNRLYLSVNRVSSAMRIWLPVQYLRLLKTGAAAVGSETRTSSKRISALVSAASSDGKRYINHDFKPGGICDPEENVSNVQKIRVPVNIEDKDNEKLILQTPQILGETLPIANRRQHVVGIVNDPPSNTCWFNVLIQSFCWNDDVALAALRYLTTNSVKGVEVLNIN